MTFIIVKDTECKYYRKYLRFKHTDFQLIIKTNSTQNINLGNSCNLYLLHRDKRLINSARKTPED